MKKIIALMLALLMTLSISGIISVFAESDGASDEQAGNDSSTIRVYSYNEAVNHTPSIWLNTFDSDDACTGTDYVIFKCAAPLKGIGLPELYAGISANKSDCDVLFELFKWDTDANKTLGGTPVFSEQIYFDGDNKELPRFTFDSAQPAGQYIFRITQLSGKDEDEGRVPYSVLPISEMKYSDNKIEFDSRGPFAFFIDCEITEGVDDYFLKLEGKADDIDVQPERDIYKREGAVPHPIFEFGIVTPVVPDGQVLYSVALTEAPTWTNKNGDSDIAYEVYKWTGDYEDSFGGKVIASGEILDHADNSNLTIKFGTALRYGYSYLIVITRSNAGAIGYYQGNYTSDDWLFYEYGIQLEFCPAMKAAYALVGDLGPEATEEPTEVPTEVPTDSATEQAATDAKTAEPVNTNAPVNTDSGNKSSEGESKTSPIVPVLIAIGCAVIIASVIVIIIVTKNKKKK